MSDGSLDQAVMPPPLDLPDMTVAVVALPATQIWTRLRLFIGGPVGAVLGGVLFAAWAAAVNRDGGMFVSLRSSCGQFLVSVTLTLIDAQLMTLLFQRCRDHRMGAAVAAIGSLGFTYALVIGVHLMLRTPHIFLTILPGLPPTLGYTAMYTLLLLRERAGAVSAQA
jgi:hypothetical protein